MQDRVDEVRRRLLIEIEQRMNARPGASKAIMELCRAYESLSVASSLEREVGEGAEQDPDGAPNGPSDPAA